MNKLGIWAIAVAGAFLIGVLSANPVAEAVGGWQQAFINHEADGTAHGIDSLSIGFGSEVTDATSIQDNGIIGTVQCPANHVMTGYEMSVAGSQTFFRALCKQISLLP